MTLRTTAARRRKPLLFLVALVLAGCKSDTQPTPQASSSAPPNADLSFQSGTNQSGAASHPLRTPIQVSVNTDAGGVDSVVVTFTAVTGGGTVTPASVRTDINGNAAAIWTLGPTVGIQTMSASIQTVAGTSITLVDSATALPNIAGAPSTLAIVSGDAQQGAISQQLTQPLVVAVTDSFGVGVSGISVTFTSGGTSQIVGGVTGNGQPVTTSQTLTTDANGEATIHYQMGSGLGIYSVQAQATLSGTLANVFFSASALNGADQAAITDLFVGKGAQGVTVNPSTNTIYVANTGQPIACDFAPTQLGGFYSYSVVGSLNDNLMLTQQTSTEPFYATANPATNMLYVAGTPSLEVWNGATNTLVMSLNLADSLHQVAINSGANQIWVAAGASHQAILISGASNTVTAWISTGETSGPHGIALNTVTNRVYTTDSASQTVTVIDAVAQKVITHIAIGAPVVGIAVDSVTNHIFVSTGSAQGSLVVIDGGTDSVIKTISVGRRLGEVAVDATGNRVYAASASLPYGIAVFDGALNQLIGFHPTPTRCPYGVAFDHALQRVYVTSYIDNNLVIFDATKLP